MYLLIDAGNTRVKFAGHDGQQWLFEQAEAHDALQLALPAGFVPHTVHWLSVAGEALNARIASLLGPHALRMTRVSASAAAAGLRNDYAQPAQLGADRWAAAVGAWHQVRGACLVVSAGTATTVDVVTADGVFAGGCILPGLDMMRAALASGTAALPFAEGRLVARPRNTADAIYAGCIHAQLGAIERMRASLPAGAPLLLAGGAAGVLREHLAEPLVWAPSLVLEGLLQIARSAPVAS